MYRILISDKLGAAGLERLDQADDASYDLRTNLSKEELLAIIGDYDALIVRSGTRVDGDVLALLGGERGADVRVIVGQRGGSTGSAAGRSSSSST